MVIFKTMAWVTTVKLARFMAGSSAFTAMDERLP